MDKFSLDVQVRWADLDPNFHLRHSIYYDWGAMCRVEFLHDYGFTSQMMLKFNVGPILFREECVFKKEIHLQDKVTVDLHLLKARRDYSRWTIQHNIIKNGDTVAAILTCDGAWLDTLKRKLAILPDEGVQVFEKMPKPENFEWTS